jgi:hypothetical protein
MIDCKICGTNLKNINGLAKHITNQHDISKEDYYNKYIGAMSAICCCGNKKKFRNLGEGYRTYCSVRCRSDNVEPTAYWVGKKQPQEIIDKRRNTMLERHGVSCGYLKNKSVPNTYKGFVCRSKYEEMFVDFAEEYEYTLTVPNKIDYEFEGRKRWYFPDFYIVELDLLIEVKSDWTWKLNLDMNIAKHLSTIESGYDIIFIDEEHHLTDRSKWDILNEYICGRY